MDKKICICSGDDQDLDIVADTQQNHIEYCQRWGYDYKTFMSSFEGYENANFSKKCFQKFEFIRRVIEDYDYVSWVDQPDVLFMNHTIPITNFINDEKDAFLSSSVSQWGDRWDMDRYYEKLPLNGGWYILKNSEWTLDFIEKTLALKDFGKNDQHAMKRVLKEMDDYRDHVAIRDPLQQKFWFYNKPDFNQDHRQLYRQCQSPNIFEHGDFMIHFAGQPNSDWLVKKFLTQVIK